MGLDCCCKFLKCIVFLINILITFVGIAVLALAALALINSNGLDPTKDDYTMLFKICVTVIVMGSLLTIVGFIGCCGAAFENQCLLGTFVCLMIAALALDVAAAIVVDSHTTAIITESEGVVKSFFSDLAANKERADLFQLSFKCCGVESYRDWTKAKLSIPVSCCKSEDNNCNSAAPILGVLTSPDLFAEGCVSVMKTRISTILENSPTVLAIVGIIEAFAMITSLGLCCHIRKAGY
ncbi:tetraspanin-3 [Daphnia magna]|uniref:Tetraspanin n=1 Tax=Daphnia magna TaxID=35525 RepID=A0A0N8AQH6_9CRUS|nr:tetraspanin-3 [Daphnia magna]KAK4016739.1 hypothetical protein OUZ56_031705 [Daphnia magna]